jgi:hypothetical protein
VRSQPAEFASSSAALLAPLPELLPGRDDFPTVHVHGQSHTKAAAAAAALQKGEEGDLSAIHEHGDVLECGSRSCRFSLFEHGHAHSPKNAAGEEAATGLMVADDIASTLALLLDDEADLRGVDR